MAEPRAAGVIAPGLFLRGELHGEDDLIIEGRVEGEITLKRHLTIERTGIIVANVTTQNITVKGEMRGDMTAADKVEIHQGARVVGNITAPRVIIAEGARFKGHIDMLGSG
jgi:cytoskeletal protein CcmA (bactofilin family)